MFQTKYFFLIWNFCYLICVFKKYAIMYVGKVDFYVTVYTKINSKWKVILKILEENTG